MGESTISEQECSCVLIDAAHGRESAEVSAAEVCAAVATQVAVRRILVALGGAPAGENKLPVAEMLARGLDADILFLHVLTRRADQLADPVSPEEAHAAAYLETIAAQLHADGLHAHGIVRSAASAVEGIVAAAREYAVDLIVLGLDIRGRVPRAFRRSVAEVVAHETSMPVVIVEPDRSTARPPRVRAFDEDAVRWGPLARWHLGVRQVALARVIGSVGRAAELQAGVDLRGSRAGRDLQRQRFANVLSAMQTGEGVPAVELYKLGSGYYVVDGNHRVAAARQLGWEEIDADVTEFVPLDDATAQRVFAERRAFERETGLYDVDSAHYPGTYPRLQQLVEDYVALLEPADRPMGPWIWLRRVYQPIVQAIYRRSLLRRFPTKRVADLVAGVAELAAAESGSDAVDWDLLAERFAERYPPTARFEHAPAGQAAS